MCGWGGGSSHVSVGSENAGPRELFVERCRACAPDPRTPAREGCPTQPTPALPRQHSHQPCGDLGGKSLRPQTASFRLQWSKTSARAIAPPPRAVPRPVSNTNDPLDGV